MERTKIISWDDPQKNKRDDNPRNVEQARLVGIHAILFQGRSKLESDLVNIGVNINLG